MQTHLYVSPTVCLSLHAACLKSDTAESDFISILAVLALVDVYISGPHDPVNLIAFLLNFQPSHVSIRNGLQLIEMPV